MKSDSTENPSSAEAFEKLRDLVMDIKFAMLTTVTANGLLRSCPMTTQAMDRDGTLWFFAGANSPKVDEMRHEQEVGLSYASPAKQQYVTVSGRVSIVRDRKKAEDLWTPFAKAWFPGGVDDPNLILLSVRMQSAEYWDSPSSKVVQLYGMAKAAVTGESPKHVGDHVKVT